MWGQTYTTTGLSSNWTDSDAWTKTNPDACGNQNSSATPPLGPVYSPTCPIRIIITHPITYSGSGIIGGGQITTLTINNGGILTFAGDLSTPNTGSPYPTFTLNSGAILNVNGALKISDRGQLFVNNSFNLSNKTTVNLGSFEILNQGNSQLVDFGINTILNVSGKSKINSANATLNIRGEFGTGGLEVGSANGVNVNFYGTSKVKITGDFEVKGQVNSYDYSDIRVTSNFISSTGNGYKGYGNSYLLVSGNHTISGNAPVYLTNNAQVQVNGTTTNPWLGLTVLENACYKSTNRTGGTACILCGETYTTDGTFYVPAGVTEITIEVWGAGGAGGSGSIKTGGGGGGGYSRRVLSVKPGQPLAVYIGIGGIANDPIASNRDGTLSYVSINSSEALPDRITNSLIFANGGKSPSPTTSAGAGGSALTSAELTSRPNSVSFKGGNGGNPGGNSGGGGSAAGNDRTGNNGQDYNGGLKPIGEGGKGGDGGYYDKSGQIPTGNGGGGGGAFGIPSTEYSEGSYQIGGNGAKGLVKISFTCPNVEPCSRVVNYGTNNDYYIVEYFCDGIWKAPDGLKEFGVTTVGGGGGGGFGNSSNGGRGGEIFSSPNDGIYSNINNNNGKEIGFPLNTIFNVKVGLGGNGATPSTNSIIGGESTVTGTYVNFNGNSIDYSLSSLGGMGASAASTQNGIKINANILGNNRPALPGFYGASGGGSSATAGSNGGGIRNGNALNINGTPNTGAGGGAGSTGGGAGGSGKVFIYYPVYRILPVEFLYFNAAYQPQDKSTLLNWSTAKEWENSHFEIERAVNSIKTWETIGRVEGNGYSDIPVEYSFTDTDLPIAGGNIFYRLKQVDLSGTFSYSVTRAIQMAALESVQNWLAYPNPSYSGTDVRVELVNPESYQDQIITISLINIFGQSKTYSLSSPEEISSIVSGWLDSSASGLYILDISWGDQRQQLKLIRN